MNLTDREIVNAKLGREVYGPDVPLIHGVLDMDRAIVDAATRKALSGIHVLAACTRMEADMNRIINRLRLRRCWNRGHALTAGKHGYCTTCHPERWAEDKARYEDAGVAVAGYRASNMAEAQMWVAKN